MKKSNLCILALALVCSLTACGNAPKGKPTTDVTWDELLAANRMENVFEQAGGFSSTIADDSGDTYIHYVAMEDGELIASHGVAGYTEDLRNGIQYKASEDGMGKSITILVPTADLKDVIEGAYGEELSEYQVPGSIYSNETRYFAKLKRKDEEFGITYDGYAYFDKETLLLDHIEMKESMGTYKLEWNVQMAYDSGAEFEMVSYDRIVNAEDTVDLTIHYPDGTANDITVDRDVTVIAFYPNHEELWAACWDEACTGRVDDLGWITGDHGDIYLCEGDIPDAPPSLNRVLKNSSFESMFKENYETYFQHRDIMDENQHIIENSELSWYVDEEAGLCLDFVFKNEEYEVTQSGKTRDNAWYFWTETDGYTVDFYDEFSYVEDLLKEHRFFIKEEQLTAPMEQREYLSPYHIPYEETLADGSVDEYKYCIHPDSDYIDVVEITHKDSAQNIVGYENWYLGGNGPIWCEKDVFTDVTTPEGVGVVQLTVVSPNGEKTYSIRKDAKITWKGKSLYSDDSCTKAVNDLSRISGTDATVYVK